MFNACCLEHTAMHCNTLQHTCSSKVTWANVHPATHCNTLQHPSTGKVARANTRTATHCNSLLHTATLYDALQHTCGKKAARANAPPSHMQPHISHMQPHISHMQPHICRRNNEPCYRVFQCGAGWCSALHNATPHCTTPCGKIRRYVLHTAPTHFFPSVTHCTTLLTLHHTAPHYPTLQHAATPCNTLQCTATATRWNTLQHMSIHCNRPVAARRRERMRFRYAGDIVSPNTLRGSTSYIDGAMGMSFMIGTCVFKCVGVSCSVLQHVAVSPNTLRGSTSKIDGAMGIFCMTGTCVLKCLGVSGSELQWVVVSCSELQ